jgi:hypothetical protein
MEHVLLLMVYVARRVLREVCECVLGTLAISVLLALAVEAAPARVPEDPSPHEPCDVETIVGHVTRVEVLPRAGGRGRDVTIVLTTVIGDEVRVAVAPQWVIRAMGLRLRTGDHIQVTGWRIVRGKPAVLAAEIGTATQLFVFRDRHGMPAWSPRRRLKRRRTRRADRVE